MTEKGGAGLCSVAQLQEPVAHSKGMQASPPLIPHSFSAPYQSSDPNTCGPTWLCAVVPGRHIQSGGCALLEGSTPVCVAEACSVPCGMQTKDSQRQATTLCSHSLSAYSRWASSTPSPLAPSYTSRDRGFTGPGFIPVKPRFGHPVGEVVNGHS